MSRTHATAPSFVAFCHALLEGRRPAPVQRAIPVGQPDALTAEAVDDITHMIGQAVTRWLFRELGWHMRDIIDPEDDEAVCRAALWEPAAWGDLRLRYTRASIDLLIHVWNNHRHLNTPKGADQQSAWTFARLRPTSNGDLLLKHLITRTLASYRTDLPDLIGDPISQMVWFAALEDREPQHLARLFHADMLPLLPWISAAWPRMWAMHKPWSSINGAARAFRGQQELWGAWVTGAMAAERPDLLTPLAAGYAHQLRGFERQWRQLQALLDGHSFQLRAQVHHFWADALTPLRQIHQVWQRAHGRHPVDRLASEHLLLAGSAACNFPHWANIGDQASQRLRGDIS